MFGTVFWGIVLILLGGLFILEHAGVFDIEIWEFWPIILVLIGLSIILKPGRRGGQKVPTSVEGGN
ncbi:MAG: hypothetical protein JSU69_04980 [Candidatus Zixiibacteriota bacterium]|nr:MAG: hypothetical protein JSU69_04980 [candidate division Zixibacteria bacterium]